MAKNYRTTYFEQLINLGTTGQETLIAKIEPIDSQQSLGSYLSNVKVSVLADNMEAGPAAPGMMVHATTDSASFGTTEVITSHAMPCGGGTGNLSLKRRILDSDQDPSRADGPVYIWLRCSKNNVSSTDDLFADVTIEAWGRFVEVVAA